jgi:hypothetical protein
MKDWVLGMVGQMTKGDKMRDVELEKKMGIEHCSSCLNDKRVYCPRNPDAQCLICEKKFCGAHISEHLNNEHCVSLNLDHCSYNTD